MIECILHAISRALNSHTHTCRHECEQLVGSNALNARAQDMNEHETTKLPTPARKHIVKFALFVVSDIKMKCALWAVCMGTVFVEYYHDCLDDY